MNESILQRTVSQSQKQHRRKKMRLNATMLDAAVAKNQKIRSENIFDLAESQVMIRGEKREALVKLVVFFQQTIAVVLAFGVVSRHTVSHMIPIP